MPAFGLVNPISPIFEPNGRRAPLEGPTRFALVCHLPLSDAPVADGLGKVLFKP